MKKLILTLTIALFSFVSFSQKYAYVDTKYILENIPEYVAAQKTLDDLSEKWQGEAEVKQKEIAKKFNDFKAEQILLTDDMKNKKISEIEGLEQDLNKFRKEKFGVDGELYKKRKELIEPIQNKIYNAVKELASTGNYSFIFDKANQSNILYANPKLDKSKRILKNLGYK